MTQETEMTRITRSATGGGLRVEVAPEDAIDAFYHPYAYASACDVHRDDEYDGTINDA
jgi:hypothetical protein